MQKIQTSIRGPEEALPEHAPVESELEETLINSHLRQKANFNFIKYNLDQQQLLPLSIKEWLPEDSMAPFLSDLIERLDAEGRLDRIYARYRKDGLGGAGYDPKMLLKVIYYCYCHGIRSSRKIAQALITDVALRYLSGNQQPDFRTINNFRKHHLEAIGALFVDVLDLCMKAKLAKVGHVALDGCKVAANASLDRSRKRKSIAREVRKMLVEASEIDEKEDEDYGIDLRGDELPEDLQSPESRRKVIEKAVELLKKEEETPTLPKKKVDTIGRHVEAHEGLEQEEAGRVEEQERNIEDREREEAETGRKKRGRKPKAPETLKDPKKKANTTDPESRIMKTRNGWKQGYNAQAMVENGSQIIVACGVTNEENDFNQLKPMLDNCEQQAGKRPSVLTADTGYWSEENARLETDDLELFIATKKDWKQRKEMQEKGAPRGRIPKDISSRERMERKLCTKRGKKIYKTRSPTVEPMFGQMGNRGLLGFLLRGIEKVRREWALCCTAHNLLKLFRSGFTPG